MGATEEAQRALESAQEAFRDALQQLEDEFTQCMHTSWEEHDAIGSMRDRLDGLHNAFKAFCAHSSHAESVRTCKSNLLQAVEEHAPLAPRFNECVTRARSAVKAVSSALHLREHEPMSTAPAGALNASDPVNGSPKSVLDADAASSDKNQRAPVAASTTSRSPLGMVQCKGSELARHEFENGYYGKRLPDQSADHTSTQTPQRLRLHTANDSFTAMPNYEVMQRHKEGSRGKGNASNSIQHKSPWHRRSECFLLCSTTCAAAATLAVYAAGGPSPALGLLHAGKRKTIALLAGILGVGKQITSDVAMYVQQHLPGKQKRANGQMCVQCPKVERCDGKAVYVKRHSRSDEGDALTNAEFPLQHPTKSASKFDRNSIENVQATSDSDVSSAHDHAPHNKQSAISYAETVLRTSRTVVTRELTADLGRG